MGSIVRLQATTIERIAAGEVVTRPARVVEELLDNAIDAGAERISVTVDGDGTDRVVVTDDGAGMSREDVALAVERHTTSKLSRPDDDLDRVETLGFRGEALAAIAEAGTLRIETSAGEGRGTELRLDGGEPTIRETSRGRGTTVEVTDLFASMPARSAALAAPETEFRRIADVLARYALVYPDVAFSLAHDGRETLSTTGRGFSAALLGVYDREIAGTASNFDHETTVELPDGTVTDPSRAGDTDPSRSKDVDPSRAGEIDRATVAIDGALVAPSHDRATADHIRLAVNGRPVDHRALRRAVGDGYGSRLAADRHPIAVVRLSLPHALVDPNVDPAKRTVGLVAADRIAEAVETAVDTALSTADDRRAAAVPTAIDAAPDPIEERSPFAEVEVIGSFRELYLLCEADGELLVVDQHAAHERINYERLRNAIEAEPIPSRPVDPPVTVTLSSTGLATLAANRETIDALGYGIEQFGGDAVRVTAVPEPFGRTATPESLRDVLDDLAAGNDPDAGRDAMLAELACHPSLKAGDRLGADEARALLDRLGGCENPYVCPHGRPTVVSIDEATLARGFDRKDVRFD